MSDIKLFHGTGPAMQDRQSCYVSFIKLQFTAVWHSCCSCQEPINGPKQQSPSHSRSMSTCPVQDSTCHLHCFTMYIISIVCCRWL